MKKILFSIVLLSWAAMAQDNSSRHILENAASTLGARDLKTLEYEGSGSGYRFGQSLNPKAAWPKYAISSYKRTLDFNTPSSSEEYVRTIPNQPPHVTEFVSGQYGWNVTDAATTPAAAAAEDRLTQIWLTPQGFVRAALAGHAVVRQKDESGKKAWVVSFTAYGKKFVGFLNDRGTVDRTQTWIETPVLGNTLIETDFADYKDFSGVKFPTKIIQRQGGYPTLELAVTEAKPDLAVSFNVPDAAKQANTHVVVESQKVADGLWYLTGGTHHSVLVEFKNYVAVIEAPLNEERSNAVIAAVKKLVPDKPLRYVINTHHHFDHSGGLRTYAKQGVTIITHEINRPYYASLFQGKFETVNDRKILTDGSRVLELHITRDSPHAEGLLLAYLPKEKILVEADAYNPAAPNAPKLATVNPATANLYKNIDDLQLDVSQILPIHGRIVPWSELQAAGGKSGEVETSAAGK